jgi:fructosamine-3-kinase
MSLGALIEGAIGRAPRSIRPLGGGCVGDVRVAEFARGESVVAKSGAGSLDIEAAMLRYLKEHTDLPAPKVLHAEPTLLIMEFVENNGTITSRASEQSHAGELLAALHDIGPPDSRAHRFGFDHATLIGGLAQPNPWTGSWIEFFAEHRLIAMAREAHHAGMASAELSIRVERFAREGLPSRIDEPARPSLLHGDAWAGNILVNEGKVAAFVDPALYFGHAEVELAFGTLFGTFGDAFFEAYRAKRAIQPGFLEVRRDIYNLYPLLVHVRLFGGAYVSQVDATLRRFGH